MKKKISNVIKNDFTNFFCHIKICYNFMTFGENNLMFFHKYKLND